MNIDLSKYYTSGTRILWHALFWIGYLIAHTLFYGLGENNIREEFAWALRYLPFKMTATYLILYLVIPKYLLKKKYIKALTSFLAALMGAALLQQAVSYLVIIPWINPEWETEYLFYASKVFKVFLGMYPVVTIAACIKLVKHWYEKENQAQKLRQQKLEAELKFLKSQIHPHFLFNTLNNLYALTLKKSDRASDVVLKLSELMNYMLYECSENHVALEKEIQISKTYLSLEEIRYGERLDIKFEVTGETKNKQIAPMLILPFLENSFKHGVSNQLDKAWVKIGIDIEDHIFKMKVENNYTPSSKNDDTIVDGIGLSNVKRRLDLLYPGSYNLDIQEAGNAFGVELILKLDQIKIIDEDEA